MRRLACGTQRGNQTCNSGLGSFGRQRNEMTDASQQQLPIMSVNLKITLSLSLSYHLLVVLSTNWTLFGITEDPQPSGTGQADVMITGRDYPDFSVMTTQRTGALRGQPPLRLDLNTSRHFTSHL